MQAQHRKLWSFRWRISFVGAVCSGCTIEAFTAPAGPGFGNGEKHLKALEQWHRAQPQPGARPLGEHLGIRRHWLVGWLTAHCSRFGCSASAAWVAFYTAACTPEDIRPVIGAGVLRIIGVMTDRNSLRHSATDRLPKFTYVVIHHADEL